MGEKRLIAFKTIKKNCDACEDIEIALPNAENIARVERMTVKEIERKWNIIKAQMERDDKELARLLKLQKKKQKGR